MSDEDQAQPVAQMLELWQALELRDHDHVSDIVMIAKVTDFDTGSTGISISTTDGVDWVTQLGLLEGARHLTQAANIADFRDD